MPTDPKTGDARLAELEQLLHHAYRRLDATDVRLERAAAAIDRLEDELAATPANGLVGVAVKLSVCAEAARRDPESSRPYWLPILRSALVDVQGFLIVLVCGVALSVTAAPMVADPGEVRMRTLDEVVTGGPARKGHTGLG